MIKVSNVFHKVGDKLILRDVSVDIPRNGITALIGPNGAGKSTVLSLIARLEPLQSGRIDVDDLEVGRCPDRQLAQKLSILPQIPDQPLRLTVRELVGFGRYPYHRGRPTSEDETQVDRALSVLGIDNLAHRHMDTLSGGQRQRAQIAMIFAQDTDYVLLDEPLNNLDLAGTRTLLAALHDMAGAHGKTIVIVVHDINIASRHADWIIAMKNGEVAREGSPENIIDQTLVREVFGAAPSVVEIDGRQLILP